MEPKLQQLTTRTKAVSLPQLRDKSTVLLHPSVYRDNNGGRYVIGSDPRMFGGADEKKLGEGSYGKVWLYENLIAPNIAIVCAVKCPKELSRNPTTTTSTTGHPLVEQTTMRELAVSRMIGDRHENIIVPSAVVISPTGFMCSAMECAQMTLYEAITLQWTKQIEFIPLEVLHRLFVDVLSGLHHLHTSEIVHLDLSTGNIMVTITDPSQGDNPLTNPTARFKIIDFGSASTSFFHQPSPAWRLTPACFRSPENFASLNLLGSESNSIDYIDCVRSDIWAFGAVALYITAYAYCKPCLWFEQADEVGRILYSGSRTQEACELASAKVIAKMEMFLRCGDVMPRLAATGEYSWRLSKRIIGLSTKELYENYIAYAQRYDGPKTAVFCGIKSDGSRSQMMKVSKLVKFTLKMLSVDPRDRPSAWSLLNDLRHMDEIEERHQVSVVTPSSPQLLLVPPKEEEEPMVVLRPRTAPSTLMSTTRIQCDENKEESSDDDDEDEEEPSLYMPIPHVKTPLYEPTQLERMLETNPEDFDRMRRTHYISNTLDRVGTMQLANTREIKPILDTVRKEVITSFSNYNQIYRNVPGKYFSGLSIVEFFRTLELTMLYVSATNEEFVLRKSIPMCYDIRCGMCVARAAQRVTTALWIATSVTASEPLCRGWVATISAHVYSRVTKNNPANGCTVCNGITMLNSGNLNDCLAEVCHRPPPERIGIDRTWFLARDYSDWAEMAEALDFKFHIPTVSKTAECIICGGDAIRELKDQSTLSSCSIAIATAVIGFAISASVKERVGITALSWYCAELSTRKEVVDKCGCGSSSPRSAEILAEGRARILKEMEFIAKTSALRATIEKVAADAANVLIHYFRLSRLLSSVPNTTTLDIIDLALSNLGWTTKETIETAFTPCWLLH